MIKKIFEFYSKYKRESQLFLFAFAIHILASIFLFHQFGNNVIFFENEDAHSYVNLAHSVSQGSGFWREGMPSAVRTPFYPLFLTLIVLLPIPFVPGVLLAQGLIVSAAVVCLYRIGKMVFSEQVGILVALLYAIEPYMLMTSNLATTETLFNVIIIFFLYFFFLFYQKKKNIYLIVASILLGCLALTRPVALYVPAVMVLLFFLAKFFTKETWVSVGKNISIFLFFFFLALSPWMIRQYVVFGTPKITNIDASMLYFRTASLAVAHEEKVSYVEANRIQTERLEKSVPDFSMLDVTNNFKHYDYMMSEGKKLILRNIPVVAKFYTISLIPALTGTGYEYILEEVFHVERNGTRVSYSELLAKGDWQAYKQAIFQIDALQMSLLFGAGIWVLSYLIILWALFRRSVWQEYGFYFLTLFLFTGYFIFFTLGPAIHARYRMPTFPFWFLLLAFALDFLWKTCSMKKTSKA